METLRGGGGPRMLTLVILIGVLGKFLMDIGRSSLGLGVGPGHLLIAGAVIGSDPHGPDVPRPRR
eukprot:11774213-Heterocapsa_arctica.AAC.1